MTEHLSQDAIDAGVADRSIIALALGGRRPETPASGLRAVQLG
jgi:hypothetical protein